MIVTDLAMTNIIKSILPDHIMFLARTIIQHPLVAHQNLNLVLANALLVITTPLLDAINHHIDLRLNYVMTATAVAFTLIQNRIQIINTHSLITLLNSLLQKLIKPLHGT